MTLQDLMQEVRLLLNEPRAQSPSARAVFRSVLRTVQSAFNQLSNTNHAWATGEVVLLATPQVEDYEIQAADFGKALSIVTQDLSNVSHFERLIDFCEIQDIDIDWNLPNNSGQWVANWDGSNHSASRMAFFRRSGDNASYVRIKPIPQRSCEYRILYAVGNWVDAAALASTPLLTEHHSLFAVRAALNLLPHASWWDDEAMNRAKRAELRQALKGEEDIYAVDWSRYIGNMRIDHMADRYTMSID